MKPTNSGASLSLSGRIVIQGGPGSHNESALSDWLTRNQQGNVSVEYAQSTSQVLHAVHEGLAEYGQFALWNSAGGFYRESLKAIGMYRFTTLTWHVYAVEHALLTYEGQSVEDVTLVITHREVFKHCQAKIARVLPNVEIRIGEGEYHDPASVARGIAEGSLSRSTATISNPCLAEQWNLHVASPAMHDQASTSAFLIVAPLAV